MNQQDAACVLLEKLAGVRTEVAGSLMGLPGTGLTGLLGYAVGPRKKRADRIRSNKHKVSNILFPGVAGYRLGRRVATQEHLRQLARRNTKIGIAAAAALLLGGGGIAAANAMKKD